jgi:hypothetical protein
VCVWFFFPIFNGPCQPYSATAASPRSGARRRLGYFNYTHRERRILAWRIKKLKKTTHLYRCISNIYLRFDPRTRASFKNVHIKLRSDPKRLVRFSSSGSRCISYCYNVIWHLRANELFTYARSAYSTDASMYNRVVVGCGVDKYPAAKIPPTAMIFFFHDEFLSSDCSHHEMLTYHSCV